MKKHYLTFVFSLIASYSFSQNTFPSSGNVGIGTNSPVRNLEIRVEEPWLRLTETASGTRKRLDMGITNNEVRFVSTYGTGGNYPFTFRFGGSTGEVMRIKTDGNVGIGTTNPTAKLEVNGNLKAHNMWTVNPEDPSASVRLNWLNNVARIRIGGSGSGSAEGLDIQTQGDRSLMRLLHNGNVGIGTTTPTDKLSVNGRIRAKEVKVEASPWPDYVFEEDYPLPALEELKKHIRENKRLPGMPSAEEVEKEGIALGEMNAKLLEKIEQLSLHLINQSELLEKQQNLINEQQKRIQAIEKQLKL